jgi:hypothetical protein
MFFPSNPNNSADNFVFALVLTGTDISIYIMYGHNKASPLEQKCDEASTTIILHKTSKAN